MFMAYELIFEQWIIFFQKRIICNFSCQWDLKFLAIIVFFPLAILEKNCFTPTTTNSKNSLLYDGDVDRPI